MLTIESVEPIPLSIPHSHPGGPTGFGGRAWPTLDILLVKVTTTGGLIGYGETFAFNVRSATQAAVQDVVAPLAVGRDAGDVTSLMSDLRRLLHLFGRGGITRYALSGLEIACWDLIGKSVGAPLHALLGSAPRPSRAYASLFHYGDEDVVRRTSRQAVDEGFTMIKLHEVVPSLVLASRDSVGDGIDIAVDVNCSWSRREAFEALTAMRPAGIRWIEEPIWPPEDGEGLAMLRRQFPEVPVAAGENASVPSDLIEHARRGALDIVQPSVIKIGGISEQLRVADAALAAGVDVTPHSPYFGPGLLATLHMACALPETTLEWGYFELEAPLYPEPLKPVDGMFPIPDGPGLGMDPLEDTIARYRVG